MEMNLPTSFIHQSFRYVIGRSTYAVGDWVDWCVANWTEIPINERIIIQSELEEAFDNTDRHCLGMEMDRREWERVRRLYQEDE